MDENIQRTRAESSRFYGVPTFDGDPQQVWRAGRARRRAQTRMLVIRGATGVVLMCADHSAPRAPVREGRRGQTLLEEYGEPPAKLKASSVEVDEIRSRGTGCWAARDSGAAALLVRC